jgi:hypothetical protein
VLLRVGVKTVRIFFNRIRDRIRLKEFKSVRIRVRIFIIRYRIRIRIRRLKSHIYDVDINRILSDIANTIRIRIRIQTEI